MTAPEHEPQSVPPPAPPPPSGIFAVVRRVPLKSWLRLALLVGLLVGGFLLIFKTPLREQFTEERMTALLGDLRDSPWTPLLVILAYVLITPLGFIPVSPVLIASGLVFGAVYGTLYNVVGLVLAAMVVYYVARALGRDLVVQLGGARLRRVERVIQRRSFWPLVQVRFLPVPFSFISYGAAMAGVPAGRFLVASTIGLIPATVIHTYFAPTLIRDPRPLTGLLYLAALVLMNVLAGWQGVRERWQRRKRYREIRDWRRRRATQKPR